MFEEKGTFWRKVVFIMRTGQRFICQNRDCRAEILVMKDCTEGRSNPRCACGAEMKKPYGKPELRKLDKDAAEALFGVSKN